MSVTRANKPSKPITQPIRSAIGRAYLGICQYCGVTDAGEIDHIIAAAVGGSDDLTNLTLACKSCNANKGHRDLGPEIIQRVLVRAVEMVEAVERELREPSEFDWCGARTWVSLGFVPDNLVRIVDEWRRRQPDIPNRSEAIRRMVRECAARLDAEDQKK